METAIQEKSIWSFPNCLLPGSLFAGPTSHSNQSPLLPITSNAHEGPTLSSCLLVFHFLFFVLFVSHLIFSPSAWHFKWLYYILISTSCLLYLKPYVSKFCILKCFWFPRLALGEGNGTPLQYSCLENPMDRETW